jgi:hypothetical protein
MPPKQETPIKKEISDYHLHSASYVQSGLIAQWDGIDNAGTGTHDHGLQMKGKRQ